MKRIFAKPLLKSLVLLLYFVLIVSMGGATMAGKLHGEDYAFAHIYSAWWFVALWTALAVASLWLLIRKNVYKRLMVMMLHLSLIVILAGALLTHLTAQSGTLHLRKGEDVTQFVDKEHRIIPLPFTLCMTEFKVLSYPGSDAVMDYCCTMEVKQKDDAHAKQKDGSIQQVTVSMNHIGKVEGYRFYQSAYDPDGEGSQLLVAHDPYGIALTYTGYCLLFFSLLGTLFSKHTRIRQLYRQATQPVVMLLLLWGGSVTVHAEQSKAQEPPVAAQQYVGTHTKETPTPVTPEIADELGKVAVLYNGRICPLNTAAVEFVTKLSGKSSWRGYSANEIFVGWMIYYTEWETQPLIKVKNSEVQALLGIDGKWASVRDFYSSKHEYKLSDKLNDATLPAATLKALREVDEKLQVVTMFYNSEMLHIFPLTVDGKMGWYTPGSTELPLGTPEAEFQFINHAMDHLTQSILVNDVPQAKQLIAKIHLYQKEKAGSVMPSDLTLRLEVLYNQLHQASWVVYLFLTLSLVLCLWSLINTSKSLSTNKLERTAASQANSNLARTAVSQTGNNLARTAASQASILSPAMWQCSIAVAGMLWLTLLLGLRWWISGHIPMSNGAETMLFMAWATLLVTLLSSWGLPVLSVFSPILSAFGPVVAGFCMLVATIASNAPQVTLLMPVLQSPLLTLHVAVVMMAYALFAITTLMAIYAIFLYKKQLQSELNRLTALSTLLLYPAVALLAIGIFIGAVWANVSWGTYWSWDPKETWALITLMVYALPLHRSFVPSSPILHHIILLLSFLTVLMTYFGVNYFLPGMHSYAG